MRILKCFKCKHYFVGERACSAFPEGIPQKIFSEEIPHHKNIKGQIGKFIFEPNSKDKKHYVKYFEYISELVGRKFQIEQELPVLASQLIKEINQEKNRKFNRGEIRIDRTRKRGFLVSKGKKITRVLFRDSSENYDLIFVDLESELMIKLNTLLHIESIENHKTDLEFIFYNTGEYTLNLTDLTMKERQQQNAIKNSILDQRQFEYSISKGFKEISLEKLEEEIRLFINLEPNGIYLGNLKVFRMLKEKQYAVLNSDVDNVIKKLKETD